MKKILAALLCVVFLAAALPLQPATGEAAAEAPAWRKAWLCGPHYGYRADVTALVLSDEPEQAVRYVPFDSEEGLYAAGEGEDAGDRAEVTYLSEDGTCFSLRLKEPGKYIICDTAYYYLDITDPVQSALRAELDDVIIQNTKEKETQMARGLHDWVAQRLSPVFDEKTEPLAPRCGDPMNALLTGCALEEAYDRLFDMLLASAGLCSLVVSGTAGGEEGAWCLSRLDGAWVWTDMSMDDRNDKKGNACFAKEDKAFAKDHVLCAADEAFTDRMVRACGFDAVLSGELPVSMLHVNYLIGDWCFLVNEGPAYVVGDSATVTFRAVTNKSADGDKEQTAEQFLEDTVCWYPWDEENKWYDGYMTLNPEAETEERPPITELVTVEEINEDKTVFTLTFHRPGQYSFLYRGMGVLDFYLISPEETSVAAVAAEMDEAVEKAKAAATETAAAKIIFQWIRSRMKYNYPARSWQQTMDPEASGAVERDVRTAWEPLGGLIYGKFVCEGYAKLYHLMMTQAELTDIAVSGSMIPEMEGHAWNLNQLDGVWTYTDPTANRFAWTAEKMNKDHDPGYSGLFDWLVFGDAMTYLAAQTKAEHKPLAAVPAQLKYLSKTAEGYGFPETPQQFMDVELTQEDGIVTVKLPETARILFNSSLTNRGDPLADWERRTPVAKEYSARYGSKSFQLEMRTDPDLPFVKKATSQWLLISFEDGEITKTVRRTVIPDKAGTYAGYNPRYHYFEYDGEMRPAAAGWYMVSPSRDSLEFRVFFDTDGNVTGYEARYDSIFDDIKSVWEGTPENPLTVLDGKPVTDLSRADPRKWEPVWFE